MRRFILWLVYIGRVLCYTIQVSSVCSAALHFRLCKLSNFTDVLQTAWTLVVGRHCLELQMGNFG